MKENLYDNVLDGVNEIVGEVTGSIKSEFKKSKPFRKEPIDNNEMLIEYSLMQPTDLDAMAEQYGFENVVKYIGQMESLKQGRQKHGK